MKTLRIMAIVTAMLFASGTYAQKVVMNGLGVKEKAYVTPAPKKTVVVHNLGVQQRATVVTTPGAVVIHKHHRRHYHPRKTVVVTPAPKKTVVVEKLGVGEKAHVEYK